MNVAEITWIALDWGTSNLRAYGLDEAGRVLATRDSTKGMGSLKAEQFEPALMELVEPWLQTGRVIPVVACGMVGAKQGWKEASYRQVPCPPMESGNLTEVSNLDPRIRVSIIPGLCQLDPPDVMRGEETQIAGILFNKPDFEGTVCLPGTHSKWVSVRNGRVENFQTFMTGEIFSLLSDKSVLRFSFNGDEEAIDDRCFLETIAEFANKKAAIAGELFRIRAASLLQDLKPDQAAARLSGLLIAEELAGSKIYWSGNRVAIIGAPKVAELYQKALKTIGVESDIYDVAELTLAGMKLAVEKVLSKNA